MTVSVIPVILCILVAGASARAPLETMAEDNKAAAEFVEVRSVCPSLRVELRYGTRRNGVGRVVYPEGARCLLRRAVAERLCRAQRRLEKDGFGLLVWDAYRPLSAQRALWKIKPDRRFVAPPNPGGKHNRGAAVDVSLVGKDGHALRMPTDFDSFTPRARADYVGGDRSARENRYRLAAAMRWAGFQQDSREWWHFQAPDWRRYPVEDVSIAPRRSSK